MKRIFCYLTGLALLLMLPVAAASAQPPHPEPLSGRRISDLGRSPSQDFFEQGQKNLEREVQLLMRRRQFSTEALLKISADIRIPPDLSPLEPPQNLPTSPDFTPPDR